MLSQQFFVSEPGAIIDVKGPDAFTYLQSQCSQNIKPLEKGQFTYSLFLTRKGKVHADAFIMKRPDGGYRLWSYFSKEEALLEKLSENLIADEVEMEGQAAHYRSITLFAHRLSLAPKEGYFNELPQGTVLAGRRSLQANLDILFKFEDEAYWVKGLEKEGFKKAENPEFYLENERIGSRIPAIPKDIGPGELPQEGGLEAALSFNKGCYLGQEVMARLQSRGEVQRQLHLVRLLKPLDVPLSLPYPLYYEGKNRGELRSLSGDGYGLALLKNSFLAEFKGAFLPLLEGYGLKILS